MKRRRLARHTSMRPMVDRLETRTLLAIAGATAGGSTTARMFHSSEVGTVQLGQELGPVNDQAHIRVVTAKGENALPAHRVPGAVAKEKGAMASVGDAPRPEFPLLDRLAEFVPNPSNPDGGTWEPVAAGSIGAGNSTSSADNVYFIAHGWMPGYQDWADKQLNKGVLPTSWETWQGPNYAPKAEGPSTPWLYQGSMTDLGKTGNFAINDTGLAESILAADPNATVLAYSWIDESATKAAPDGAARSEAYTTMNGMRMAEALMTALAPNYDQGSGQVHLIGHSHGARVATVAALALQQAAAHDPQYNVVGQLTLLDSPENPKGSVNPVNFDAANFDWFYLAQLNIAQTTPLGGTTGAGTVAARPIFVDNYVSYVGTNYSGFTVNDPNQGIDNKSMSGVVDVNLNATTVLKEGNFLKVGALRHEYAANWYAGSVSTKGTQDPVGLMWSPLIPKVTTPLGLQGTFTQNWATVDAAHQFVLTPTGKATPVTPVFTPVALDDKKGMTPGDVTLTGPPSATTEVTLVDTDHKQATFQATLDKPNASVEGFSFNYDFTGGGTDGAQLQIYLNNKLYFAMTGTVAESSILPGSGDFSATFGLGREPTGNQKIRFVLVPPNGSTGTPTTVTVSQFHEFTLGASNSSADPEGKTGKPSAGNRSVRPVA